MEPEAGGYGYADEFKSDACLGVAQMMKENEEGFCYEHRKS